MRNVTVETTSNNTILVRADSQRFGDNAIVFKGRTYKEACNYIARATQNEHFKLDGMPDVHGLFTDTEGETLPKKLFVRFENFEK